MTPYKVRVLEALYDEEEGFLVLNCWFYHLAAKKIVPMHKQDFNYRGNEVPDIEMHRTAKMLKGKDIDLAILDDPNREKLSKENYGEYVAKFNQRIDEELDNVCEGLSDEQGQIRRKLGSMVAEGKLDASKLVGDELSLRNKLGGIG